jgi:two-component system, cell cycle sensor histidine kinase and response regulator CckA
VVIELNDVVGAIEPMLRRLLRANVAIETSLAAELGCIRADRGQIEQVLVNLVVNASDAMPEGGRVTIATSDTTLDEEYFRLHPAGRGEPGRYVMLEVADTGHGMDDETIAHIFEPFFTTKGTEGGTGLGLATVYGIVRQSRGFVRAYSELERGTTFKVYLPVVDAEVEAPRAPGPELRLAASGRTVLLVEDDVPVRAVVRRMWDAHGFLVLEAGEGRRGARAQQCKGAGRARPAGRRHRRPGSGRHRPGQAGPRTPRGAPDADHVGLQRARRDG